jgi:hypothetical protein
MSLNFLLRKDFIMLVKYEFSEAVVDFSLPLMPQTGYAPLDIAKLQLQQQIYDKQVEVAAVAPELGRREHVMRVAEHIAVQAMQGVEAPQPELVAKPTTPDFWGPISNGRYAYQRQQRWLQSMPWHTPASRRQFS